MGVVYKARDRKLGRLVAVKMIRSAGHASPAEVARFLAEARAKALLDHAHVVPIFEIGEADGLPYFVMALVEGGSLQMRLADGPLPTRRPPAWCARWPRPSNTPTTAASYPRHQATQHPLTVRR